MPSPIVVFRCASCAMLAALSLLVASSETAAQPRDKCVAERAAAENHYLEGQFDEAVGLLQACLDREALFVEEAVQVYRLLALAYMNRDALEQAEQAIRDLLEIAPAYQADPIQDPPSYTTMVRVIRQDMAAQAPPEEIAEAPPEEQAEGQQAPRQEQEPPPVVRDEPEPRPEETMVIPVVPPAPSASRRSATGSPKTWFLATGGALVVVAAVVLALGGGSDSGPSVP